MAKRHENDTEPTSVFFSYSRVDQQEALPIIHAIERAGYRVWWDGMLEGGTSFLETTEEALESAQAVVVLWSKTSVTSHWVRDEAMSGRIRERLIPLSLDGTMPPLGFRQVQIIDFKDWNGQESSPQVKELHRVLAGLHGKKPTSKIQTPQPRTRNDLLSRRNLLWGGAGLASVVVAGLGIAGKLPFQGGALHNNGIAVLPFQNLTGDPANDYIASGLASEIRDYFARNKALQVVARSSSQAIAKQELSARQMAEQLGVASLLDGRIHTEGNSVRVSVELINGKTGFSRWNKDYTKSGSDILAIRTAITEALIPLLTRQDGTESNDRQNGGTQNPEAFNEYLKGRALLRSLVNKDIADQAIAHLDTAIRLDGNFGSAYAKKAQILLWLGTTSSDTINAKQLFRSAVEMAQKAVRVSPKDAQAQSTLGYVLVAAQLNIRAAREPYQQSLVLGAGDATVLARYATYMSVTSQHPQAITAIKRALILDPLNATLYRTAGLVYYAARQYEDAISACRQALRLAPKIANAHSLIGNSMIQLEKWQDGVKECTREPNAMERLPCIAVGEYKLGNKTAASQAMDELVSTYGDAGMYQQVQVLSSWGDVNEAMSRLQKAVQLRDSGLTLAGFDPALVPLHGNAAFTNLLVQLGLRD